MIISLLLQFPSTQFAVISRRYFNHHNEHLRHHHSGHMQAICGITRLFHLRWTFLFALISSLRSCISRHRETRLPRDCSIGSVGRVNYLRCTHESYNRVTVALSAQALPPYCFPSSAYKKFAPTTPNPFSSAQSLTPTLSYP